METINLTLKYGNSNEYVDVEVPYDFLIYQLIEVLTIRFEWATSSIEETQHKVMIEVPGKEKEYVDAHRSLVSLQAMDGLIVTVIPDKINVIEMKDSEWEIPK